MTLTTKHTIGFLVFDDLQALDLFGPQEVFAEANQAAAKPDGFCYETCLVSLDGRPVRTQSGVEIVPQASIATAPSLDTLILPGGSGSRPDRIPEVMIDWIRETAGHVSRIGSVCTGLFILARTGLVDDGPVTTHWHNVAEARATFPHLDIVEDKIFVRNGRIITAAGITSGIDMALSLVEQDLGTKVAAEVARELVVFLRRPGGQRQYSSVLESQSATDSRFADLLAWIAANLTADLSASALAERACMSERHFRRAFAQRHNQTPAAAVERIRIDVAKGWLTQEDVSIQAIAANAGFRSADAFSRAFLRQVGIRPSQYRRRFGPSSPN
jgi:transcriptional regulator GlxA family with amidase domain